MRSFSAVTNFRSTLNVRWKQFGYSFERRGSLFNWSNICFANRVTKPSLVLSKVGVYFSHFIFSDSNYISSSLFFFDLYFDRKYTRFSNLMGKIFKVKKPNKLIFNNNFVQRPIIRRPKFKYFLSVPRVKLMNVTFVFSNFKNFSNEIFKYKKVTFAQFNFVRFVQFFKILGIFSGFINSSNLKNIENLKRLFSTRIVGPVTNIKPRTRIKRISNKRFNKIRFNQLVLNFFFKTSISKFILIRLSRVKWKKLAWKLSRNIAVSNTKVRRVWNKSFYMKFKVIFLGSIRFFLAYYFKYNPIRLIPLLEIYQIFFQGKRKHLAVYAGHKFRYTRYIKRSVNTWLLKSVYAQFLRNNFFFIFKNRYQIGKSCFGDFKVNMRSLSGFTVTPAALISKIFTFRLKRRERLNPILYSLVRLVLGKQKILGLTISKAGRFTKKQRTAKSVTRFGRSSFNSFIMPIDYSFSTAILKYSMVSIKIWISFLPPVNFFVHKSIGANSVYPTVFQFFKNLNYL